MNLVESMVAKKVAMNQRLLSLDAPKSNFASRLDVGCRVKSPRLDKSASAVVSKVNCFLKSSNIWHIPLIREITRSDISLS